MSRVWMSSIRSSYQLGDQLGLRTKFFGQDWEPASDFTPVVSEAILSNMNRSSRGFALDRLELAECAAIWNEKQFNRVGEILSVGFYVVRGKLAEILARFDLGEGGLVPFPVYKADLETPYGGEFFLLNFGARKNSILPDKCEDARKFYVDKNTGQQIWFINDSIVDGKIVVSTEALEGADLWMEEVVHDKIFMSDALASSLQAAGFAELWRLQPCQVEEVAQ